MDSGDPEDLQDKQRNYTPSYIQDSKVESGEMKLSINPSCSQSSVSNASNGRLVYVRRRVEVNNPKVPSSSSSVAPSPGVSGVETSPSLEWEERYYHLQMLLNKLNETDLTGHVQMLCSLSSAELSKHAVDLEKKSIQLSLEEVREMQRVAALNVLGRSVNSLKSTTSNQVEQ